MRITALIVAIGLASGALATAASAADPSTYKQLKVVRLDSLQALDNLRSSNPRHYAIARKIMAAANEICDAHEGAPMRMKFEAQDLGCASSFWFTSNPPKRALSFRIDDTLYYALVEVRNLGTKLRPADPAWSQPVLHQPGK